MQASCLREASVSQIGGIGQMFPKLARFILFFIHDAELQD
jgi:hypothetical protein